MDEKEIEDIIWDHLALGIKLLIRERGCQYTVSNAAHAIYERIRQDLAWEGNAWAWANGLVDFEPADNYLIPEDLLQTVEDGEAVWMTITKLPKVEEAE